MAHNLNIHKGRASFFSVKEKAWHGLGEVLEDCPTSEEAIKYAGLNFEVGLSPLLADLNKQAFDENGQKKTPFMVNYDHMMEVPGKFATYRKDNGCIFGVVGSRYEIVQNRDAFEFFDAIVGKGEAIYETAGALGNGETIFITAKLPSYIRVGKDDDIEKYLLLTMAHDGSKSIQAMFTPIRVVCNNTLSAALKGKSNKVTIRHTKSAHENLKRAHEALGIVNMLSDELGDIFNNMARKPLYGDPLEAYIESSLGLTRDEEGYLSTRASNIKQNVLEYMEVNETQKVETCRGTLYGAYNAVTGYLSNVKDYKDNNSKKMQNMIFGTDATINNRALNLGVNILQGKNY